MTDTQVNGFEDIDVEALYTRLRTSSVKRRVADLNAIHQRIEGHGISSHSETDVVKALSNTYALYIDRHSRQTVQQCLRASISGPNSTHTLPVITSFLRREIQKLVIAPSSTYVLLQWCSVTVQEIAAKEVLWSSSGNHVIEALAACFERFLATSDKETRIRSAHITTRRAIRAICKSSVLREDSICQVVAALTAQRGAGARNAPLLGMIGGVAACIPSAKPLIAAALPSYHAFYARDIVGSRTALPHHIAGGLRDFFGNFETQEKLEQDILPVIERALLRAPEVVLHNVIPCLVKSLPPGLDLSSSLRKNLLKPLMSSVKSSNADVRGGALSAFEALSARSKVEEHLGSVSDEILKNVKDTKSADQRTIYASMLSVLQISSSDVSKAAAGLSTVVIKESNEDALRAEVRVIGRHVGYQLLQDQAVDEWATKIIIQGLRDKKPMVRRTWALEAAEHLWPYVRTEVNDSVRAFAHSVFEIMIITCEEALANPVAAVQSGAAAVTFIQSAFALLGAHPTGKISPILSKLDTQKIVSGDSSKPSFLFNHRVYGKLSSEEDLSWFLRALQASSSIVRGRPESTSLAWAQAFIFAIASPSVHPVIRRAASSALTECYVKAPSHVAHAVIKGLWSWLEMSSSDDRDGSNPDGQLDDLESVVRCICVGKDVLGSTNIQELQRQMIALIILCRKPLLQSTIWIELCLKVGLDPKELVTAEPDACLREVRQHTSLGSDRYSASVHRATCQAAAELAFVASDTFTPKLVKSLESDLDPYQLEDLGPEEAAIYRTPEGTAVFDVLSKKDDRYVPNKNVKDYDTLAWENELREQMSKKQGSQKKLSQEDTARVKAQLEKETLIREKAAAIAACLYRGVGIIQSLAEGPPTEVEAWIGPAIRCLLGSLGSGATMFIGNAPVDAYITLSRVLPQRLGHLKQAVGLATVRLQGAARLPLEMEQEPLNELLTRVLYRLRFSSEQRPLDPVSLLYTLPLVDKVLSASGDNITEVAEEQILLALEFLGFHMDQFSNLRLPRKHITSLLIQSMQRFPQHHRILKDCILGICSAISPEATESEIAVFLKGCIVSQTTVRAAALQAIDADLELPAQTFCIEIWLACHDDDEENVETARSVWEENELVTLNTSAFEIIPYLESRDLQLRNAAARALVACVTKHHSVFERVLVQLQDLYIGKAKPRVPERDAYGMLVKKDLSDPWEARHGIALALKELARVFDTAYLIDYMAFVVEKGPLADMHDPVREAMIAAATNVVALQGALKVEELLGIFETTLDSPSSSSKEEDKVNEAVVILYGALARHLKKGDERIPKIVGRLINTLSTPSETVQYAVAACLPALVQTSLDSVPEYIRIVTEELLHSKKYAGRRGAAYGLAGIVQGKGIVTLREARLMSTLRAATEERKDSNQRQGAFLAYELLSMLLGSIFEPYVIQIVPQLLAGFGDVSADVREACLDASKSCFSSLSSFGVKEILPTLLEGLDEVQWRSKKGACDSLGAMAYLDPQQLALSLPDIIPPLTNVLNDSHKEVRGAANRSLQRFGDVISNPEIKGLVGVLLKALSDPTKHTDQALDSLLKVSFVHYLDAPSLALVVRILERGLGDRSGTKRKSAQVIGSLAHLTDRKDLVAHLPILVFGLRVAAVDPVPATRATASKALGSLVEKLGEDALPDLIPSLMSTLKTETGAGDQLGSAQALSEVLAGLGVSRLEETLPTILQNATSTKANVREGFMSLFIFLPACFGNSFANYLGRVIPPILSGLADDIESIRETSLRAGRLLVKNFASRSIDLLLPELQRGLGDINYRIRLSSVELVGDLLFNLTGISAKAEDEDADEDLSGKTQQSLVEALGEEKRANVLSALYITRCDTSGLVRTAAIHVWKTLVATPRTLREITPTLTQMIIRRLASTNAEQKHIAGNALGELIRKAGDGVLASLLPTLEDGLEATTDVDVKQGICIALKELISSASQDTLENFEPKLISVVRTALVDSSPDVRDAAADAFDALQRLFGKRVIDQILPNLLGLLRNENEADNALAALLTLLTENTRSSIILPNLLPNLLSSPISTFDARALASLASVAGPAMTRRLSTVLNALLDNTVSCKDEDRLEALDAAFDAVMLSVDEFDGLNSLMSVMLGLVKHDDHHKRRVADLHFANFFAKTELNYARYHSDLVRCLLLSFDDRDIAVVKAAWQALSTFTSHLDKESMEALVVPTRQVLSQVGVPGHDLPGFLLPKGINAILPIFLHGLVNGSPDHRVQAALAISEMIDKSSGDALKPFVTQITGPLIRVVSERSVEVKSAILVTLNHLLEKIPTFLKPFLPQLQRTFSKSLADTTSEILRMRAAKALGTLITLTTRIDPLIGELVTGAKTSDLGVRNAMQKALYEVISKVGQNMSEASRAAVIGLLDDGNSNAEADEATTITNARLLGALIKNIPADAAASIIKTRVLTTQHSKSSMLALNSVLLDAPTTLLTPFPSETLIILTRALAHSSPSVAVNAVLATGKHLLTPSAPKPYETIKTLIDALVPLMQPGTPLDTRRLALTVIRTVARTNPPLLRPNLPALAPPVFSNVRDMVIPIKLAAEAAFLGIFDVVDEETAVFDKYMASSAGQELPAQTKRAMSDYFKRIAMRLAGLARERRESEGGGLTNDEMEDEKEVYSVGRVELGEAFGEAG